VVVSAQANSIDLFGLGADLTMLHRSYDGNKWSAAWDLLGGAFSSPPVVLPAPSGIFGIFARGLDFLIYHANWKPGTTAQWSKLGGGLRGEPTSASAPAAVSVHNLTFVFTTADDGAIWYTVFDGNYWKPWASLGIVESGVSFVSEPVVTCFTSSEEAVVVPQSGQQQATPGSTPVNPYYAQPTPLIGAGMRIDVFRVGTRAYDGSVYANSLRHKWLDSSGWHGQLDASGNDTGHWEPIRPGGQPASWACAPSIYAPNPHKLSPVVTQPTLPPINFYVPRPGQHRRPDTQCRI
jgi:hypothetical protein